MVMDAFDQIADRVEQRQLPPLGSDLFDQLADKVQRKPGLMRMITPEDKARSERMRQAFDAGSLIPERKKPSYFESAKEQAKDVGLGVAETAANVIGGAVGFPAQGIAGIAGGIYGIASRQDPSGWDKAGEWQEAVGSLFSQAPTTKTGEVALTAISYPLEKIHEVSRWGGDQVEKATGSAELATATATIAEFGLLSFLPKLGKDVKTSVKARADMRRARKAVETISKEPPEVQQQIDAILEQAKDRLAIKKKVKGDIKEGEILPEEPVKKEVVPAMPEQALPEARPMIPEERAIEGPQMAELPAHAPGEISAEVAARPIEYFVLDTRRNKVMPLLAGAEDYQPKASEIKFQRNNFTDAKEIIAIGEAVPRERAKIMVEETTLPGPGETPPKVPVYEIKPVSPEVLKEYPELAKEAEPPISIKEEMPPGIMESEKGAIELPGAEVRESVYQHTVNRFAAIENATTKARSLGADVPMGVDAGKRAREYLSVVGKAQSSIEHGTFYISREGKKIITGEGLKPILKDYVKVAKPIEPSKGRRKRDWNDYVVAERIVEDLQRPRSERDPEFIATPDQVMRAKAKLRELTIKYGSLDLFKPIAQRLYDYKSRVLYDNFVRTGVMSEEAFQAMLAKNPHHVPFYRVLDEVEPGGGIPRAKNLFTGARSPIKRIKGSTRDIYDPMESIIKDTFRFIDIGERNSIARMVADWKDISGMGITEVKPMMVPVAQVEGKAIIRPSQFKPKGNVIEYFDNGKRKYIEVPQNLYKAMSGMNEVGMGLAMKIISKPAHWLRVGATITPEFMFRNFFRDQFIAKIQTNIGFRPFIDSTGAIADILGKTDVYYEWLSTGGAQATYVELSRANLGKQLQRLKGERSLAKELNIVTHAQDISQLLEQATRLGVYKASIRAGKMPVEASFISRESTVDFFRRGSSESIKKFNQATAFFNAGVQGLARGIETFKKYPVSSTAKATMLITVPSIICHLLNKDDPDYREIPRWQKDLFWCPFKIPGTSTYVRIPKPFLFGQVFGSVPERFMEYAETKDPAAFKDLEKSLLDAVLPTQGDPAAALLPTALKPLIENATNWSFSRERPVVPESRKELLPYMQHGKYTSETLKDIGKALNMSPAKLENLIRGYTGGTGQYALEALDWLMEKEGRRRPAELADYPLARGFVTRPVESQPESLDKFYRLSTDIIQQERSYKKALKENRAEALEIRRRYPPLVYAKMAVRARKTISQYTHMIDIVINADMPDEQKREKIKMLETRRMGIAKNALKIMERQNKLMEGE